MERRSWSEAEDQCLKLLFESGRATKWSQVAREMEIHGFRGRNGVQCKERYFVLETVTAVISTQCTPGTSGVMKTSLR